jgi:hypothetical protein
MGAEYLVLWLRVKTQIAPIDEGCGMDFTGDRTDELHAVDQPSSLSTAGLPIRWEPSRFGRFPVLPVRLGSQNGWVLDPNRTYRARPNRGDRFTD